MVGNTPMRRVRCVWDDEADRQVRGRGWIDVTTTGWSVVIARGLGRASSFIRFVSGPCHLPLSVAICSTAVVYELYWCLLCWCLTVVMRSPSSLLPDAMYLRVRNCEVPEGITS